VEGSGLGGGRDCLREMGGSGARAGRSKGEGRAKEGRTDAEVLRMVWGWKRGWNGGGMWLNGKKCVFLQNNTDG